MRVIILSKAPVAGKVKTRLMPVYSAEKAADIHVQMLEAVMVKVCDIFDDVWLAVDDVQHEYFRLLEKRFRFVLISQGTGDLGQRLSGLTLRSFEQDAAPVMFLGTDSPHVNSQRYTDSQDGLKYSDVVIGPVEDGGYDLIAMRSPYLKLFENIEWGSDSVFRETMDIIRKLDVSSKVLELSFDLDRPKDLERAPPESWSL